MESTEGKMITCKAAVLYEFNTPVKVESVGVLPPTPGHVRVKMVATALCHSDVALVKGFLPEQKLPCVIGHEGVGIVESVGDGVTSVKKGDKVFTLFFPHCNECPTCLSRKSNYCLDIKRKVPILAPFLRAEGLDGLCSFNSVDGNPIYSFSGASSFSEYTVIPENSCVKVNPKLNVKKGCIMACGFLTGYGSSANAVNIKAGDSVAVWGLGGVGLACVVGCKEKGASKIIGIDVNEEKEAVAKKLGCTNFISLSKLGKNAKIKDEIMKLTGLGLDYAFVCIGISSVLEDAIACIALGGTAVMVGLSNTGETSSFVSNDLLPGRKVQGTIYGDYNIFEDVPKLVDRYVDGKLPLDDFITNTFTLDQINDAIALLKQGKGLRSVIEF